jgi:archaellum component FlaG (FlaF/FlaG flagellin family)
VQPKQLGTVHFDSEPRGAQIIIDGQVVVNPDTEESVRTPATISIFEGRHDFLMRIHGLSVTGYVDVYEGTTVNIHRNFEPATHGDWGQPEPQIWLSNQNVGAIRIYSEPDGAEIYIDGNAVFDQSGQIVRTPVTITDVPDGVRQIIFTMPGYIDEVKMVDIYPNAESNVTVTMRPSINIDTRR